MNCTNCGLVNQSSFNFCVRCGAKLTSSYANFAKRFAARIIDSIILLLFYVILFFLIVFVFSSIPTNYENIGFPGFIIMILFVLIFGVSSFFYHSIMISSPKQATVGKIVMRIKVTDLYGKRISFKQAALRQLIMILSDNYLMALGNITFFFTEKKQTLHDLAASTLVLKSE